MASEEAKASAQATFDDLSPVGRALDFVPGAQGVIDHFVVCGLDAGDVPAPGSRPDPPRRARVLWAWPEDNGAHPLPAQLLDFCFPRARAAAVEWVPQSAPELREALIDPQHETADPFVFTIGGGEGPVRPVFGLCVQRRELALLPPPLLGAPRPSSSAFAPPFAVTFRCYALLSRHPLLPLLHDLLSAILSADFAASAQSRREVLDIILPPPAPSPAITPPPPASPPTGKEDVIKILAFCKEVLRVPQPGDVVQYRLPGQTTTLRTFRCPVGVGPRDSAMSIVMEWSVVTLFQYLSLENALRVVSAVLCERSVLFVCEDLSVLTSMVLATLPTARPLSWQGIFIPLLPTTISDCIEAPVPYIIGVPEIPGGESRELDGVVVVDVIKNRLVNHGAVLPQLPDGRILHERLRALHQQVFSPRASAQSVSRGSVARVALAHSISLRLVEYTQWIAAQVAKHYQQLSARAGPQHTVSIATLIKSFTSTAQSANRQFVNAFISTQQFAMYFHRYIARSQPPPVLVPQQRSQSAPVATLAPSPVVSNSSPKQPAPAQAAGSPVRRQPPVAAPPAPPTSTTAAAAAMTEAPAVAPADPRGGETRRPEPATANQVAPAPTEPRPAPKPAETEVATPQKPRESSLPQPQPTTAEPTATKGHASTPTEVH